MTYAKESEMAGQGMAGQGMAPKECRSLGKISSVIKETGNRLNHIANKVSTLRCSLIGSGPDANKASKESPSRPILSFLDTTLDDLDMITAKIKEIDNHLEALEHGCNWTQRPKEKE